ncbi:MAG: non-specific endonuclease [Verrucomicrobiales bacterium]|nr:non-specific endonuclease [Verrucomicrobiales bacterium]
MSNIRSVLAGFGFAVYLLSSSAQAQSTASLQYAMGNPSGATTDTSFPANYFISKPQYAMSYYRDHGIPNWVSWHLGNLDLGSAARCDCFSSDTTLPTGWYRVTTSSYTSSGYDRGHMCPSADRTATSADNSATFKMTNILPQAPDNNQGPWAAMEDYLRSLIASGKELYVISGGDGSKGTIDVGRVQIPAYTWKVVMVLNEGSSDLSRVTTSTRLIAVDMPNNQGIRANDWKSYRTSVDQIEAWTGYNLFSAVPASIQSVIEAKVDNL